RAVIAVNGDFVGVAVGDRAGGIDGTSAEDRADDFHFVGTRRADAVGNADRESELRRIRRGEQQAAVSDEFLKLVQAVPAETGAHVVGRVVFADEVRRFQRVFPGQRIAPGRRNAIDDERGTGGETYWWEHDDVVLGVQVTDLGKGLGAHVVVWNAN